MNIKFIILTSNINSIYNGLINLLLNLKIKNEELDIKYIGNILYNNDLYNDLIFKLEFMSIDSARDLISKIYSKLSSWINFINILDGDTEVSNKRSKMASSFSVILNMVNEKEILTKQDTNFGDIYIKKTDKD